MKLNLRTIKYYIAFLILGIGGFSYFTSQGIPYYTDPVQKNTEYNRRGHGVIIHRYYHK